MEHVIHINDGGDKANPLAISLLPGEEIPIDLKVINHGEPSNISLRVSGTVSRALRLKRANYHVANDEVIPILARMPESGERLEGEIILFGGGRESRLPITLFSDSEENEDYRKDWEETAPGADEYSMDGASEEDGNDWEDGEASDEERDRDEDNEGRESYRQARRSGEDGAEREPRRISFSRDRDLQMYRSAAGRRRPEDAGEGPEEVAESRTGDGYIEGAPRYSNRIDDRFVDRRSRQDQPGLGRGEQEAEDRQEDGLISAPEADVGEEAATAYRREADSESREIIRQAERAEIIPLVGEEYERQEEDVEDLEKEDDQEMRPSRFAIFGREVDLGETASQKVVPAFIFLVLVSVLILTFVTESIPEFPGALASSILIVTLIIYGAATLLKA
jgi:hypothetical protein